jgi:hypothetical protein
MPRKSVMSVMRIIFILLNLIATNFTVKADMYPTNPAMVEKGRYYGFDGRYEGRIEKDGHFYDQRGKYEGRTDENGRSFNEEGQYI